ncbi:MAG: hypothetical protein BWY55_00444 [archaeon ADurb.Bin336]|nr:MAG: hypothetical protein BWY55_00444 [archaeon ADurb.Bin336]
MQKTKLIKTIRLFFLVIITTLFLTAVYSSEVPKSETIIIPGELNDSKENAQFFDNELEYVYGQTLNSNQPNFQKSLSTQQNKKLDSWRKTTFSEAGTLVITLSYDIDSNYSVEVYNSCSNKNYCEEYEFGTYKTCVMNIEPGEYYFKVKNIFGRGNYYLDVDLIKGQTLTKIDATKCINIKCFQDEDCGKTTPIDSQYCENNSLIQKFNTPICINPGKEDARCESTIIKETIQNCEACFNGACINQPTLNCPTTKINNTYSFTWNSLNYNKSIYLELSPTNDFKTKKRINVTKLNSLPIDKYFKTIIKYEESSKDNFVYARIMAKNSNNETIYSNTCKINTEKNSKTELLCPTQPINETHSFTFTTQNTTKNYLQISYDPSFPSKNTTKINTGKTNNVSISKYYKKILDYTNKTTNKILYARIIGKDTLGRETISNTCEFKTKELTHPNLTCPNETINSNYSFEWNSGDYTKSITLELSYKEDFKPKTIITTTKLNPTPIQKKFKTLQNYSKKNPNGELYARITAKNNYNQTTTSNTCKFKLSTTTLSKENNKINTAHFEKQKTTLTPTIENNNDKYSLEINQRINEDGEIEEIGTYSLTITNQNTPKYTTTSTNPFENTCIIGETGDTPCRSDLAAYNITVNYMVYDEIRYKYIDCTTGEILGRGQLCIGETSPSHHRPEGHSTKFEYEAYQCSKGLCKATTPNLCLNVSCSNFCFNNWKYYNGKCNNGVCSYSRTLCASGCSEGNCKTGCPNGCPNYCVGNRLYYNGNCSGTQCNYSSKICNYGCLNGECKPKTCTTGQMCKNNEISGYRNSDCTWDYEEYCEYGCENGECNEKPISHYYSKCSKGDRYWYNSLDQREDKREECGENSEEESEQPYCNGNNLERKIKIIERYCSNDRCRRNSETQVEIIETCLNGCSQGACKNSPTPGDTDYCTPEKPCQAGLGNCKKNNDCEAGLRCVEDVGTKYGYTSTTNVCEAAPNIYTQTGWTCKDPNTMAYLLDNGKYTNELPCKHGCSNGSCFMPAICDPQNANLSETIKTQKILFAGIDNNAKKASLLAPVFVGAAVVETIFLEAVGVSFLAIIGTTLIMRTIQGYSYKTWPDYIEWEKTNLEKHYKKHVIDKLEWGRVLSKDEYEDICKKVWESNTSRRLDQTNISNLSGDYAAYSIFENVFIAVTESGKIVTCFRPDPNYIDNLIKKGVKDIPLLPSCQIQ